MSATSEPSARLTPRLRRITAQEPAARPRRRLTVNVTVAGATAAIVAIGLAWRVAWYLANWPLWGDEAFLAVSLLTRDFAGLARPLEYHQIAPLGFLWIELAAIRTLGSSEYALRLAPFLAGVGSLFLFWRLAAIVLSKRATLIAVAIFAASFYPIRHATEVKPYATDLFLALVALNIAWPLVRSPGSARRWLALGCVAVAGVWISYPMIFVAAGIGLATLPAVAVRPLQRRPLACWAAFGVATVAAWLAMYLLVARPQALAAPFLAEMETWEDSFPPLTQPWKLPWWLVQTHTGNMLAYPHGGKNFGSLLTTILVAAGVVSLWRRDRALLGFLLAPIVPALGAAALHRYPYGTSARISLFLAPTVCLLAGHGFTALALVRLPRRRARRVLRIATAGLALMAIGCAALVAGWPRRDPIDVQYRRIAADLAAKSAPGEAWVMFNGMVPLPRTRNIMLMPWLGHAATLHYYMLRNAPGPLVWMPAIDDPLPRTGGRTWYFHHLVGWEDFPLALCQAQLGRMVERFGAPTSEQEFWALSGSFRESVIAYTFPPR